MRQMGDDKPWIENWTLQKSKEKWLEVLKAPKNIILKAF